MFRGYTVKLYPNKAQQKLLEKHFGCARWVYNEMIRINQKKYHRTGKGLSGYDMQSYLPKLKKQYPWLSEVNSQSLQIVCNNLADAYGIFFKKKAKYPSFKKRSESGSFSCINNSYIDGSKIRLPKLGFIRFRGSEKPEGKIRRITVKKSAGKYYASVLIDTVQKEIPEKTFNIITGIDVGITDLIVTSHGECVKAPKYYRKAQSKLKAAQKRLNRAKIGSNRRKKARLAVACIHEKIRNQRKDFNHKITRQLVNDSENQAFATESLSVKNMMQNRKLSKAIADCGWDQFKTFLMYKAAAVGKPVLEIGRFFPSSKTCSACGLVHRNLALSERAWTCECGAVHHRDINAARNIALEAARNVAHGGDVRPRLALVVANEVQMCI